MQSLTSPRIGIFVEKRFHGLFSKKMALKSGGFASGGFVIERKLMSTSSAEQNSDQITWIQNEAKP